MSFDSVVPINMALLAELDIGRPRRSIDMALGRSFVAIEFDKAGDKVGAKWEI